MIDKVKEIFKHFEELEQQLARPEVASNQSMMEKLGREYNDIRKSLPVYNEYVKVFEGLEQALSLVKTESDQEMIALAKEEIAQFQARLPSLEQTIRRLLVPQDPNDLKNAMVEIRAGTGGTEAGIFAADLYRMYTRYAERKGWKLEILSSSYGDVGAIKEIIFMISGQGAYGSLKYESGVHRVQRVPDTEAQGRIHTSAASVAVFPEADEVDVQIDPNDLRIDVYRSGGHGGQSVNTTDSAVRIVHIPTGLTVVCQDEKSQLKNKSKAMKVLQSRLYDHKMSEIEAKETAMRRSMVSTGDRSAKIRTYNFPQGRLTDHRINFTIYRLPDIIDGDLQEVCDTMAAADINERIKNLSIN
jgi:peptide chain release factor 1